MGDRPRPTRPHRGDGGDRLHRFAVPALIAALLWFGSGLPTAAGAQAVSDTDLARRAHSIASEVMSPYCPGRTLADCPSPDATAMRSEVRGLLAEGMAEDEVVDLLEARFGDAISGVPRSTFGWVLPAVLLLAGAALIFLFIRRLSTPSATKPATPGRIDPGVERDLDRHLNDLDL